MIDLIFWSVVCTFLYCRWYFWQENRKHSFNWNSRHMKMEKL